MLSIIGVPHTRGAENPLQHVAPNGELPPHGCGLGIGWLEWREGKVLIYVGGFRKGMGVPTWTEVLPSERQDLFLGDAAVWPGLMVKCGHLGFWCP